MQEYSIGPSLGILISGRSFQYRLSEDMKHLFRFSMGKVETVFMLCPGVSKDLTYVQIDSIPTELSSPSFAATIDPICSHPNILRLKHFHRIATSSSQNQLSSPFHLNDIVTDTIEAEEKLFLRMLH